MMGPIQRVRITKVHDCVVHARCADRLTEGLAAPPPPYSPPQGQGPVSSSGLVTSPAEIHLSPGNISRNNTPVTSPMSQATHSRDSVASMGMGIPPPPPRNSGHDSRRSSAFNRARPMSMASMSQVMSLSTVFGQDGQPRQSRQAIVDLPGPPTAKRAASTGAVSFGESSAPSSRDQSESRSASRNRRWQPGMPLPGPPPNPPPATSRSNSRNKVNEDTRKVSPGPSARSQAHRVPLRAPMLSPMPPTPADWTEDQPMRPTTRTTVPLHIETRNLGPSVSSRDFFPMSEPVGEPSSSTRPFGALVRSTAFRDSSAKGIRERRNFRKSLQGSEIPDLSALSVTTNPWAEAMASAASATKSPTVFSDSPQQVEGQGDSALTSPAIGRPSNSRSGSKTSIFKPDTWEANPCEFDELPRSPIVKMKSPATARGPMQLPTKTLPTPPLSQKAPTSGRSIWPSSTPSLPDFENDSVEKFSSDSLQRHQGFLQKESQASSDVEKFQVFADYLATESVLRQKRYAAALSEGQIDLDTTRKRLFDEADGAVQLFFQQHAAMDTPVTSVSSNFDDVRQRPETMWWNQYQPALSPIASMSNDEMSSRGRTSSRWWESQAGSQTEGGLNKIRRSKRESKYMGLSTTLMQSSIDESDTPRNFQYDEILKEGEYPEEKGDPETFGMYEEGKAPISRPNSLEQQSSPNLMDVSRFITLPPPYPRHYPAVNNAHPVLANYRLTVRGLSELSEIKARKSRHAVSIEALRNQHKQKLANGRSTFKNNVQVQIQDGTITYAEAAEAEEALCMDEKQIEKESLQAEFDTLQDVVISPLHDMLNDRLVQLSASIGELTEKLFVDAQDQNPDRPQQEGDDMPELLEYLTQLKWMFETREQIQKEIFDLLTERNDAYKSIVLLPYRQANNLDKVRDTEAFFGRDTLDRRSVFCRESLARHEEFFNIVEDNVARGVALQSSAFWDIAPGLLELLQHMPADVRKLDTIAVPEQEYLENPSYYRHPQQYVYTVLDHAEKSTYQFIESQINLHCLLHEVKSSILLARCRKMEMEQSARAQPSPTSPGSISEYRNKEESALTAELKQKVSIIEEQWLEALGSQLQGTREQVKRYLEEQGAWEEMVRDEE